jgi:uncharacterized repeat protein (TIGR03803 family)
VTRTYATTQVPLVFALLGPIGSIEEPWLHSAAWYPHARLHPGDAAFPVTLSIVPGSRTTLPQSCNGRVADDKGVIAWQLEEATQYLTLRVLLPSVRCSLFDQSCNLVWPGYVDRVTGAGDFDLVAVGSCGRKPLRDDRRGRRSCMQRRAWLWDGLQSKYDRQRDRALQLHRNRRRRRNAIRRFGRDAQGNLFGTTEAGGQYGGPYGFGTVFKIDTTGKETVFHSFNLADGYDPEAGLAFDARGNLYGTTRLSSGRGPDALNGVVFRLNKTDKESVLHRFGRPKDGYGPTAGVVRDAQGNLYGTTAGGARWNCGTVFKVDKTGKETLLYVFTGGSDGASRYAGLVQDTQGNLYGTTTGSFGTGGTVFKIAP